MKKYFIIILLFFISSNGVFSQGHLNSQQVLEKVSANMKSHQTIEVKMVVRIDEDKGHLDTSIIGNMKIKGDKFLLQASTEMMVSDGIYWMTMDTVDKRADIKKVDELKEDEIWPHTLFNFYESGFKSQAISTKKDADNRTIMHIELTPERDKKLRYGSVGLDVDIDKFEITKITLRNKNQGGESASFEIRSMQFDMEMDDSIFTIDKTKYKER